MDKRAITDYMTKTGRTRVAAVAGASALLVLFGGLVLASTPATPATGATTAATATTTTTATATSGTGATTSSAPGASGKSAPKQAQAPQVTTPSATDTPIPPGATPTAPSVTDTPSATSTPTDTPTPQPTVPPAPSWHTLNTWSGTDIHGRDMHDYYMIYGYDMYDGQQIRITWTCQPKDTPWGIDFSTEDQTTSVGAHHVLASVTCDATHTGGSFTFYGPSSNFDIVGVGPAIAPAMDGVNPYTWTAKIQLWY